MNYHDLNEAEKAMLWTFGALHQLVEWNLIGWKGYEIPPKGIACFDQLDAARDVPGDVMLKRCLVRVFPVRAKDLEDVFVLMKEFRDNRDNMRISIEGTKSGELKTESRQTEGDSRSGRSTGK